MVRFQRGGLLAIVSRFWQAVHRRADFCVGEHLNIGLSSDAADLDQRILVIGDSHSKFWTGYNNANATENVFVGVDVERLGPITAYGLPAKDSPVAKALERLLGNRQKGYGLIMMCFSEVDIRAHIVTFAILRQRPLHVIADDVADCYLEFVDRTVAKYGIPVALWGPPPSRPFEGRAYNRAIPATGTPLERNYITAHLTEALANRCHGREKVAFFSLFDKLIGADFRTIPGALYDACHMSNAHLPAAIEELYRVLDKLDLQHLRKCLRRKWPISLTPSPMNVGATATWQVARDAESGSELVRADLLSAFLIREIKLDASCFSKGETTLTTIDVGEEDRRETIYSAGEARENPADSLSIAIKSRRPHRFITFTFAGKPLARPQKSIEIIAPTFSNTIR
jgi:hypothetical protein